MNEPQIQNLQNQLCNITKINRSCLSMPSLTKIPASEGMNIDAQGVISGLS